MSGRTAVRLALGYLAISGLFVGVWAAFAPRSFFSDFPGLGLTWTAHDGAYNEHLVRDVGDLNLALVAVSLCACVWLSRTIAIAAAAVWLVYSAPHLAYHAANLQTVSSGDRFAEIFSLSVPVLLALIVLAIVARDRLERDDASTRAP